MFVDSCVYIWELFLNPNKDVENKAHVISLIIEVLNGQGVFMCACEMGYHLVGYFKINS